MIRVSKVAEKKFHNYRKFDIFKEIVSCRRHSSSNRIRYGSMYRNYFPYFGRRSYYDNDYDESVPNFVVLDKKYTKKSGKI